MNSNGSCFFLPLYHIIHDLLNNGFYLFWQKAEKCAVRLALKLEKAGYSETRLWHLLKDNQKGIQGFYDEMKTAVLSGVIEVDRDARKPKVIGTKSDERMHCSTNQPRYKRDLYLTLLKVG